MNTLTLTRFCLATGLASAIAFQITTVVPVRCETSESARSEVPPGKLEYKEACARCHGEDGRGRRPTAPTSTQETKDLTILAKNNGGVFPEQKLLRIIHNTEPIPAHGPHEAPVWGKQFSLRVNVTTGASNPPESSVQVDYRVKQLMQYLKSIQEK